MKTKHIIYFFLLSICVLTSCTTSQKITVSGTPGTEIYSPNEICLGVVQNDGQANISLSSDTYYSYLMSKSPNSSELVPFALDYKHKSYTGAYALRNLSIPVASIGFSAATTGIISGSYSGDSGGDKIYTGAGFGGLIVGGLVCLVMSKRCSQVQYKHKYKYLSRQTTNQDVRFVPVVDTAARRSIGSDVSEESQTYSQKESVTPVSQRSSSARGKSSVSKRTIKDGGKLLAGTYVGNGVLRQGENTVEKFNKVTVVINRIDKDHVAVEVFEGGESFFSSKSEYSINKKGAGYILTLKGIPSATITIYSDGKLAYYHPKVNIDGDIYALEISASKK